MIEETTGLDALADVLAKSKYIKRTGGPGHYKYEYLTPSGRTVSVPSQGAAAKESGGESAGKTEAGAKGPTAEEKKNALTMANHFMDLKEGEGNADNPEAIAQHQKTTPKLVQSAMEKLVSGGFAEKKVVSGMVWYNRTAKGVAEGDRLRSGSKPPKPPELPKTPLKEGSRVSYRGTNGTVKGTQGDATLVEFDGSGTTAEAIITDRLTPAKTPKADVPFDDTPYTKKQTKGTPHPNGYLSTGAKGPGGGKLIAAGRQMDAARDKLGYAVNTLHSSVTPKELGFSIPQAEKALKEARSAMPDLSTAVAYRGHDAEQKRLGLISAALDSAQETILDAKSRMGKDQTRTSNEKSKPAENAPKTKGDLIRMSEGASVPFASVDYNISQHLITIGVLELGSGGSGDHILVRTGHGQTSNEKSKPAENAPMHNVGGENIERGVKQIGDRHVAVNGDQVKTFDSKKKAVNHMKKMGYDAQGNKISDVDANFTDTRSEEQKAEARAKASSLKVGDKTFSPYTPSKTMASRLVANRMRVGVIKETDGSNLFQLFQEGRSVGSSAGNLLALKRMIRIHAKIVPLKKSMGGLDALGDVLNKSGIETSEEDPMEKSLYGLKFADNLAGTPYEADALRAVKEGNIIERAESVIYAKYDMPWSEREQLSGVDRAKLGEKKAKELIPVKKKMEALGKVKADIESKYLDWRIQQAEGGTMQKGMSGLGDLLEKSKYTRRTGGPGNYRYEYDTPGGTTKSGTKQGSGFVDSSADSNSPEFNSKNRPKVGKELLLTNRVGVTGNLVVTKVSGEGVELSVNKHSKPVWATTWSGLNRAVSAATGDPKLKSQIDSVKKSISGMGGLGDLLEKSGLPTHSVTKLGHDKSATIDGGSAEGGDLDGLGKTSGDGNAKPGPGLDAQGNPTGTPGAVNQKLSEDDDDPEKQMTEHKKPIENPKPMFKSLTPANQREYTAHETAIAISRLRKGVPDVQVGAKPHPMSFSAVHGGMDTIAAGMLEDTFYKGCAPTLAPSDSILRKAHNCSNCGKDHSGLLTACPNCGDGMVKSQLIPQGGIMGGAGMILDNAEPLLREPKPVADILFVGKPVTED